VVLSRKEGQQRQLHSVSLRASLALHVAVVRDGDGLRLVRQAIAVDARPLRVRGRVGDGLYWSLRAAGVSPQSAAEYLRALATEIDVGGDIAADDSFDLVIASRRSANGERQIGPLLYAGIDRSSARDLQLVKWGRQGRTSWVDAANIGRATDAGMTWPVAGRITSGFGYRIHPILRFARLHRGIDFGASTGTPIVAAADGQVAMAGWAGGYGRQVRIAHAGGMATSYSHMSEIVAEPGAQVRRGQLIGYVGSSGLSTGPHLHYEVHRGGQAVNPLSVRFTNAPAIDGAEIAAFKARLKALLSVGSKG
jgi:murein DD-endopeptidase MepM/ murein hydrolase activator NlpD